jgi:hypothetical protein
LQKNRVEKSFYQKLDQIDQKSKTDFFSIFLSRFWACSGSGVVVAAAPCACARLRRFIKYQGAGKKKNRGPPWWVGGSEYEKGLGSDFFFSIFFIVFLNSPHRETPKNVIKQIREKVGFRFLVDFFVKKLFGTICFVKRFLFFVVFLNSRR